MLNTPLKHTLFIVILAALSVCYGCTLSNCDDCGGFPPGAFPPHAQKLFDASNSSLQITSIFYNQDSNRYREGVYDEWITLEADSTILTKGWRLRAADANQFISLPDTIYRHLTIYSHSDPDSLNRALYGLQLDSKTWLWNDTLPDTAFLMSPSGQTVDSLSYRP